ncbi:hypothetical protein BDA99DRAFT_602382 [Phascolomyces articulosus]|uniref:Uncharacterized protein n=1 Tax=Phascolomyces articulosus TaxID=60185 RepID=A0AAD5KMR0_9FUNG|nr:hypothetical protein BDA99DRAFT_602382 [Phascolomyces articulosus]
MPAIPTLKEKYAFAKTLEERQEVIRHHALVDSDDWYYYRGLTLLAQLQETLLSSNTNIVESRQPTEDESKLVAEIRDLLDKYSNKFPHSQNQHKLKARYHLLLYPLDPITSTTFIREELRLAAHEETQDVSQQQQRKQEEVGTPKPARRVKPGDFDPTLLNPSVVLEKALGRKDRIEAVLAFSYLRDHYDTPQKERQVLHELLQTPHSDAKELVVQRLTRFCEQNKQVPVNEFATENLTLEQMEWWLKTEINAPLIERYINKLGDDIEAVWSFVKTLGDHFNGLKGGILYYKLKQVVLQNQYEQVDPSMFEMYWNFRHTRHSSFYIKEFPQPTVNQRQELIDAYLAGALTKNPKLELKHLDNYESELKIKHATILLTHVPSLAEDDHWRSIVGTTAYRRLVENSELGFSYATLSNTNQKNTVIDNTKIQIKVKNMNHVSIRVFAIDLQQYWRLHPTATSIKVDSVDGLCPTWEKELDYSQVPAIQIVEDTIDLETLAPEVFEGRGAWVIDFVGGRKSCRAIIQKGRLRHIWKDTSAGHLFRILDEKNAPIDANIMYRNECFEPNQEHNILIPYQSNNKKNNEQQQIAGPMLIVHDEFCEPLHFTCKEETYDLEVDCYVNPESLVANRQTKVVVNPRLTIYDQPVPLQLLESVTFTVEATNNRDVKSTFTQHVSQVKPTMEFEFTVPNALSGLSFHLRGQVKAADGTSTHDVEASYSTYFTAMQTMSSAYLRTGPDGYFIQVLGKNGEPQRNVDVQIDLTHTMVVFTPIEQKLRTNDKGIIHLGKLEHVSNISIRTPVHKEWPLLVPNPTLPWRMHQQADTSFKIPGEFLYCNVFQTLPDNSRDITHDFTHKVDVHDTHVAIEGLPEGSYRFFLASKGRTSIQIECIIIASDGTQQQGHWADWLFGKETYAQTNAQKPLCIQEVQVTDKQIVVGLLDESDGKKQSSTARAIVTATAFVPEKGMSVTRLLHSSNPRKYIKASLATEATFLTGRTLSEEFEYVLNRARAEKWIGSTLTKPSILVYPDEGKATTTHGRDLEQGATFTGSQHRQVVKEQLMSSCYGGGFGGASGAFGSGTEGATNDLGFLNHYCPSLIVTPNEQGQLVLDRSQLGNGNILHIAILQQSGSGEQVLVNQRILDDVSLDLQLNDSCQQGNPSINYVQSKAIAELLPQQQLTLNMNHEWEVVDSFQKMFTLMENMATRVNLKVVDFLKQWPTYTEAEKLKKHDSMTCHEINLWIKFKDPEFFAQHLKPSIAAKLTKDFIDYYLLEDMTTLRTYADSIHLYEELTIYEKALLAKKIPDLLPVTLQAFLDAYTPTSDSNFDAVLAGSSLQQSIHQQIDLEALVERGEQLDSLSGTSRSFFRSVKKRSAGAPMAPMAFAAAPGGSPYGVARLASAAPPPPPPTGANEAMYAADQPLPDEEESDDDAMGFGLFDDDDLNAEEVEDDDDDLFTGINNASQPLSDDPSDNDEEQEKALRDALRQRQSKKIPFQFTQPTKEWKEKGYYQATGVSRSNQQVNRFWIDYLESDAQGQFLSGNFIYAISGFTEVIFALALSDLPFKSQWKQESDIPNNKLVISVETPCLVFYRQLKEAQNAPPTNPSVLLGQNFFSFKDNQNTNQDELDMVDPTQMEPATEYGWHVAISNVSSKKCDIEVTLQVPVGAIPTGNTPYCQSKTLQIQPYSTWQSVVGSFYFPSCGEFGQFPVTVASRSSMLIGATSPLKLHVKTPDTISASSSWTTLSSSGSDDQVMTYLLQANLDKVAFGLLRWRLSQPEFARRVIDTLRHRRFYSLSVWQYALYHRFPEAIKELLENQKSLLERCGAAFESPLVSTTTLSTYNRPSLLEYSPVIPARQHPLGSNLEIRNQELHKSYLAFLDLLAEKQKPSQDDLLVLTIYLVLQERIGDARQVYERIDPATSNMQYDYLGAYLETRLRADQIDPTTLDLSNVRQVAEKHLGCSQLKWRKMFTSLLDYVDEVERQQSQENIKNEEEQEATVMPERQQAQTILTEPVLDFDVDQNELVLHYAKVKQVEIRYYKTDVEVMFSHNPFNRSSDAGWVKPHVIQKIDLEEGDQEGIQNEDPLESFEVIGIGKTNVKTRRIPVPSDLTHAIVQVNGGGLKRRKPYFAHSLLVNFVESYGMVRVADKKSQRPIAGTYVKVYVRYKGQSKSEFWKDGYTGLNGVFDYVNVTEASLDKLRNVDKFSLLVSSTQNGAMVEEVYPPSSC